MMCGATLTIQHMKTNKEELAQYLTKLLNKSKTRKDNFSYR
jgi:hypothetical protein